MILFHVFLFMNAMHQLCISYTLVMHGLKEKLVQLDYLRTCDGYRGTVLTNRHGK